jgi:hypothetical protein
MTAVKSEVSSNLEIKSTVEKFRRVSSIMLDNYVAKITAEQ